MKRFTITHAAHLHPPYGLWIVRHKGVEIGRQLSQPSADDCETMLARRRDGERPLAFAETRLTRTSYHLGGAEATLQAQRRGGYAKAGKVKRDRPGRPRKHG